MRGNTVRRSRENKEGGWISEVCDVKRNKLRGST